MKSRLGYILLFLTLFPISLWGQVRETYRGLLRPEIRAPKLAGPQHLREHVVDGKLLLSLHDAIILALENNSSIRVQETQVETSKFALLHSFQPFDPQLQAVFQGQRLSYPGFSQVQGEGTFSGLTKTAEINYTQRLQTGTSVRVGLNSFKNSSNSGFYFLNPYYQSFLELRIAQPLLRNGWRFPNQAPVIIARTNLQESRATFEAQVNAALLDVIMRYWELVRGHNNLDVARKSQEAAEATHQHDKRALELGALPPLDIYRSESEVASRRVQVIQAEYALKQAEESLRLAIGANQDPYIQALDIEATESPDPPGELLTVDTASALKEALENRPEMVVWQRALQADDTGIRLAHNQLLPDLQLEMFYQGSGTGGDINLGPVMTRGGLGTSLNQVFGFGFPGYGATLTLNLPIRNRAAQAELGTALVARHHDLYSAQQTREEITREVRNAVHQLEQAKLTIVAGKTSLALAQKMLSAEQRKTELGTQNLFLLLDAQTRVATAEASLLEAEVNYQTALAAVHTATGSLLQEYHVQIAQLGQ